MSISINLNTQKIIYDKEYRCPKCSIIPFINIFTNENKLFMSMKCTNNHNYSKTFDEMEKISKTNPISNYSCALCENDKKLSNVYYYCLNCYKFYCIKHGETHNLKEKHKIFFRKNFDSSCTEHKENSVVGYCKNHNKNYCFKCNHFNENNRKIEDELNDDKIDYYENEMKKIKNFLMFIIIVQIVINFIVLSMVKHIN